MDYLFTDQVYDDKMWRGVTCRACGALPARPCVSPGKGTQVPSHTARRHDLIMGRTCDCGRCHRAVKLVDRPAQN